MTLDAGEVRVDYASIERSLAELWRSEKSESNEAVTRAALWNVVAHTWSSRQHSDTSEILGRAAAAVPQRTIIVRAEPDAPPDITSWISANCHLVGREKQVCSEEVSIVAGGDHLDRVPPLVNALLIPDMPVALWWVGDLPNDRQTYVDALLEPADRLIIDSSYFDSASDLETVSRIAHHTTTAPADLNWVRLEEWRIATAMLFDPPAARERLRRIERMTVVACASGNTFGDTTESLLFAAWIATQSKREGIDYRFETETRPFDHGSLCRVSIEFDDATMALVHRDDEHKVLIATLDGATATPNCVTRVLARKPEDLIVRQLKRPEADQVYVRALKAATELARMNQR